MRKEVEFIDGIYVTRRTKKAAEKDYNAGYTVYIVPVNMPLRSMWSEPARANKEGYDYINKTFQQICNSVEYYQCNAECGRYLKYYTMADSEREER